MNYKKYAAQPRLQIPNRKWPNNAITQAPIWCSVDLRDGNQALINPMNIQRKTRLFSVLLDMGFKEIEVGFPSASSPEFDFIRKLADEHRVPDDVTVQVLTQAREHLIRKTFASLKGLKRAIVHMYNSTSTLQRRVVFKKSRAEIIDIALEGTRLVRELASETETDIIFEYSPESFTGTEMDFALEICQAVIDTWGPSPQKKMIINLPATVEMSTPNVYADQIEYFGDHIGQRDSIIISVHTHNDRGTGVAATELALLAGADRVEGTLFGNGERTGNVDLVNVALNMYSHGVDPKLHIDNISNLANEYQLATDLPIHPRHPYVGDLVFTAFSGSHQDAIRKGFEAIDAIRKGEAEPRDTWEVPYLPIDPADIGKTYEAIVRINSQSGKGGVAYIMESEFGCSLPKEMHPEFASKIQKVSERTGGEVQPEVVWQTFEKEYVNVDEPLHLTSFNYETIDSQNEVRCKLKLLVNGEPTSCDGQGNGPIEACCNALQSIDQYRGTLEHYSEHSIGSHANAKAISYIAISHGKAPLTFGVGIDENIMLASIRALLSACNRHKAA